MSSEVQHKSLFRGWRLVLGSLVIAVLAISLIIYAFSSRSEPIKIGFLGVLTGRGADLGISGRNGALLAIEAKNQQGGIHGEDQ